MKQSREISFGKRSGLKVHPVSMGGMRFPKDVDEAILLIRQAIDSGMIYIDTSRGYSDSETKLARALKNGYREKVILSTKWCPWNLKVEDNDDTSAECTYKRLRESMKRLDAEYLDFYQIWSINNREQWEQVTCKGGMLDGILRAKKEGLVKHIGFTTHDTPENIEKYIDEADWCEAILFTYNMLNRTYEDSIAKAHEKGIATIVMNPISGGVLVQDSPPLNVAVKNAIGSDDLVETAHRWLKTNKNIDTIICGIAKPSDITSTLANYEKPDFTPEQIKRLNTEFEKISIKNTGFCVDCKYCLPCPKNIYIPGFMNIAYFSEYLKVEDKPRDSYNWMVNPINASSSADPSECIECGRCEQKCTQRIKIIDMLKRLKRKFG
ncbi:MAG: aldo/keto reductase [Planctomycetaceae bacterium]|nr:aldo/keto reductase [Planctomycetaceae bacterium]